MDSIYYNGELIPTEMWTIGPNRLLSENYVYQHLHTFAYKPLHLETHIEIFKKATCAVFGEEVTPDAKELSEAIEMLLKADRYPAGSNQVTAYIFPIGADFDYIWLCHIYCGTSGMEIKQVYFHSSQFLIIFAAVASHILFTPQQCNSSKFACIAFCFCVYL